MPPSNARPPYTHWCVLSLRPRCRAARLAVSTGLIFTGVLFCAACAHTVLALGSGAATLSQIFAAFVQGGPAAAAPPYPLQTVPPYTVALDAGHGGADTGANGLVNEIGMCESTIDRLYALLDADANYTPVRTRPSAESRSTTARAQSAIAARASLLLSIHGNYDSNSHQSHGFECFPAPPGRRYAEESMRFAQCIAQGMGEAGHRLRGETGIRFAYYDGKAKRIVDSTDTKVRTQKSFGVLEKPLCPAVLAEQCFVSNASDVGTWASPEGCTRAARIYYEAICAYFGTQASPPDRKG